MLPGVPRRAMAGELAACPWGPRGAGAARVHASSEPGSDAGTEACVLNSGLGRGGGGREGGRGVASRVSPLAGRGKPVCTPCVL